MLRQVAANYLVADAVTGAVKDRNAREGVEETPAGQIATLEATRQLLKVQAKQGYPNPFFPHPCDDKEERHCAALPMALEMAIATELRAIELATPDLSADVKLGAATDAAIDRLKGAMSTGRRHNWERIIAERLVQLADGKLPWGWIDPAKALTWVEDRIGLVLARAR